ncbi:uncharacterized protein TNIN_287361 [Trichonephila inaurata madagascariensis]|uniref:Uncharacterized protein n=1 Tax=Trichonephila inaurata madagascariensis TaxID=2747483 RepID=A0A8X7BR16_9ARAC|nr:uncharacterized protein TNIN_287361 [Trichonephila inaurata madagascariensis]
MLRYEKKQSDFFQAVNKCLEYVPTAQPANIIKPLYAKLTSSDKASNFRLFKTRKDTRSTIFATNAIPLSRDKIGENIKLGATVLFIDNINNKVYESLQNISQQCGLSNVLGPQIGTYRRSRSKAQKDVYGCLSSHSTRVSVIGWIKTIHLATSPVVIDQVPASSSVDDNDDSWDTESDSDDFRDECSSAVLKKISESKNKPKLSICKNTCDKFTQTESKHLSSSGKKKRKETCEIEDLKALMDALNDLVNVVEHFKLRKNTDCSSNHHCCSHCC